MAVLEIRAKVAIFGHVREQLQRHQDILFSRHRRKHLRVGIRSKRSVEEVARYGRLLRKSGLRSRNDRSIGGESHGGHWCSGVGLNTAINRSSVSDVEGASLGNLGHGGCGKLQCSTCQGAVSLFHGNILEANSRLDLVSSRHLCISRLVRLHTIGVQLVHVDCSVGRGVLMSDRRTSSRTSIGTKNGGWPHCG